MKNTFFLHSSISAATRFSWIIDVDFKYLIKWAKNNTFACVLRLAKLAFNEYQSTHIANNEKWPV